MNPWGSEAPMMTFAVQAYQHQWLLQVGLILIKINLICTLRTEVRGNFNIHGTKYF